MRIKLQSLDQLITSLYGKALPFGGKNPPTVTVFGFFGMKNVGDDALLAIEVDDLRKLNSNIRIFVPSRYPNMVRSQVQVFSFRFGNIPKLLYAIIASDIVVIGGGGLFCNPWKKISIPHVFNEFLFTLFKLFWFIYLPKLLGKKVIAYGIGYYDNQNKPTIWITSQALRLLEYISVRDVHSYNFLRNQLRINRIVYQSDIAYSISSVVKSKHKLHARSIVQENPGIAISLVNLHNDAANQNMINSVAASLNNIDSRFVLYFCVFSQDGDKEILKRLESLMCKEKKIIYVDQSVGPQVMFEIFGLVKFAICTRFHSIIFALMQETPLYGIAYDMKCLSVLKENDLNYIGVKELSVKENFLDLTNTLKYYI